MLHFELHEIQWKASPVDFEKVWDYEAHAKFVLGQPKQLVDVTQADDGNIQIL